MNKRRGQMNNPLLVSKDMRARIYKPAMSKLTSTSDTRKEDTKSQYNIHKTD